MKNIGYRLIQIAGSLILLGGLFDVLMTFILHNVPKSHVDYLKLKTDLSPLNCRNLTKPFYAQSEDALLGLELLHYDI